MTAASEVRVLPSWDPRTLRDMAAQIEWRQGKAPGPRHPALGAVARLSDERKNALADLVGRGQSPTVGWWRRAYGETDERMAAAHADLSRLRDEWNGAR